MELRDVLYQMMQRNAAAMQPTDLCVGTVVGTGPLQVSLSAQTAPLRSECFLQLSTELYSPLSAF